MIIIFDSVDKTLCSDHSFDIPEMWPFSQIAFEHEHVISSKKSYGVIIIWNALIHFNVLRRFERMVTSYGLHQKCDHSVKLHLNIKMLFRQRNPMVWSSYEMLWNAYEMIQFNVLTWFERMVTSYGLVKFWANYLKKLK